MGFRPCIDIHGGKVKQIIGGSLKEHKASVTAYNDRSYVSSVKENFVSEKDAAYYASLYKSYGLSGGHIILLDKAGLPEYHEDLSQAVKAVLEFPGGFQLGGGITAENIDRNDSLRFLLDLGVTHFIVTSYAFSDGRINYDNINKLVERVGKDRLVLDLSCRKKDGLFYVVTDRWQKFTDEVLSVDLLKKLGGYCDEFLVHAVDVEGKAGGVETEVVKILSEFRKKSSNKVTYAGGISSYDDIRLIDDISDGMVDYTIGSALDIFGGKISFERIAKGELI